LQTSLPSNVERWMPVVLVTAVLLAYAPVFGAGFLSYDDPWLIQHNPFYAPSTWDTPFVAFFDFSEKTRLALGAEYLPLRDLLGWLETRAFGLSAAPMHAVSVLLYAIALLLLRSALRCTLGPSLVAELAVLLFALHPIHVESVAWLAGQKDVLALLFVAAALRIHAHASAKARIWVPLFLLAATCAKAMSVGAIFLFAAQDYLLRRRPDRMLYLLVTCVASLAVGLHLYTARVVSMISEPPAGSRYAALITMGPVWLRYVRQCLFPFQLSITYHVPDATSWDMPALAGYLFVLGSLVLGLFMAARGQRFLLFAFVWFFAPLLPVSQIIAPLQNRMADRYVWLSVLAPCMLLASLFAQTLERTTRTSLRAVLSALVLAVLLTLAWLTFERSLLFTDSVLLFADATLKAEDDPKAAYHLGRSLEEAGREHEAMLAFREALDRCGDGTLRECRSAANSLARLLAKRGQLPEAERVLERARQHFPQDPKLTRNLAKVLRGLNRAHEAEALERGLQPSLEPSTNNRAGGDIDDRR
jgi:tetratricopeptide (TPR) repeat protein